MTSPMQSPMQPIMRSPLSGTMEFRRRGGGSAPFDIASTNPSAYYDRTNLATLFQDSAGTTAVTAGSQPIGLGLDQSQGLVLGPELVTGGDFSNPLNWNINPGWTVSGGTANFNNPTGSTIYQSSPTVVGTYQIELDASGPMINGSIAINSPGTDTYSFTTAGHHKAVIRTTTAHSNISINGVGTYNFSVDNFSVKLLAGNHQSQATAGKRPIADGSPIYANFDGVDDDLVTTFPASLGSGCTVCRSLPGTGADITTGVTLTATYTDNVDAHALLIYTAAQWAALDAGQIANITTWLNGRAGL